MKLSSILGLNARTQTYAYRYNTHTGKNIADSKIQTARVLKIAGVAHPKIYKKFKNLEDVYNFDFEILPDRFAVKPSRGLGGEGIIVVKKKLKNDGWLTTQKKRVTIADIKFHISDILEGAYSMGNDPDVAFIQEYVGRHTIFRKWAFRGTPDIRVIVFNKIPVLAMLRLPTKQSGGRANLHQGAIGVGIDIGTGVTTKAILEGEQIIYKPDSIYKLRGIKVPMWTKVLDTAVNASIAAGLGYCGVDVVLHPDKGPMILELNAQPGLQIQLANGVGLKRRLERVDELEVRDAEHGVAIAKALFTSHPLPQRLEDIIKIKAVEEIIVRDMNGNKKRVLAKVDTGAWSSAIDRKFAKSLGLLTRNKILWYRDKLSALGKESRPVIPVTFWLGRKKIKTNMTVANRKLLRYDVLVGRVDLGGFLVSPEIDKKDLVKAKW
ncbi:MAG: sugar-transfer associated ATP-grasp domain-containing protein [Patescibacteria group bacterium]